MADIHTFEGEDIVETLAAHAEGHEPGELGALAYHLYDTNPDLTEEEAFEAAQQERRAAGLEPEAIPAELYNWRERAVEEVRRLAEEAARQRRYEAEAQWKWKWQDFDEKWTAYVKNRIKPSTLEPIFQEEKRCGIGTIKTFHIMKLHTHYTANSIIVIGLY